MEQVAEKPEVKAARPPLSPSCMTLVEAKQRMVFATVPAGITKDELLVPGFWAHIAKDLPPWTEITVMPEDEAFYAKLLVRDSGRLWALCAILSFVPLAKEIEAPVNKDYEVKRLGPQRKFGVRRLDDNEVIRDGFVDTEAANAWLAEHLKALGR
jgi:hypothetical protein